MTENRYYEKNYEESYYIFDSKTLSEKEFEEKVEYDGYTVFEDSLTPEEVIDLLNENEELKKENEELKQKHYNELMEEGVKIERLREQNEKLKKENEELKERVKQLQLNNKVITKIYKTFYKPRGIKYA